MGKGFLGVVGHLYRHPGKAGLAWKGSFGAGGLAPWVTPEQQVMVWVPDSTLGSTCLQLPGFAFLAQFWKLFTVSSCCP